MLYNEFVERVDDKLRIREFKIWRDVHISGEREVSIFATDIKNYWMLGARIPVHLLVAYSKNPSPEEFLAFFEQSLAYSRKAYSSALIKRVISSLEIVTCLVSETADQKTIEWVNKRHSLWVRTFKHVLRHGSGIDFYPVLHCLESTTTHYWKGWTLEGSAVWPHGRRVIQETVETPAPPIR
jgi:hypothetical protein